MIQLNSKTLTQNALDHLAAKQKQVNDLPHLDFEAKAQMAVALWNPSATAFDEIKKNSSNLEELSTKLMENYHGLSEDKKSNIVHDFLDLKNHGKLNLDDAILLFDEYFIIENVL